MTDSLTKKNLCLFWIKNARPVSLPQSVFPALLALVLAYSYTDISIVLGLLALLGVSFAHLGLNLFDDYFDFRSNNADYRDTLAHEGFRARIGKCLYITSGKSTVQQLLYACCIFCAVALCLGGVIYYFRGEVILYVTVATAVLGLSYSGAPLRFSHHGMGELLIGLIFGPILMIGVFYVASGTIDIGLVLISIPVGLLVTNMLFVHSILDYEPDKKIGKRTLAVLLDNKSMMLITLLVFLLIPYLVIIVVVLLNKISYLYLLVLLSTPMAASLFYLMRQFIIKPSKKVKPYFWMGGMSDWDRLEQMGIGWFMLRWYLARNLLMFFCLLLMLAGILSSFI